MNQDDIKRAACYYRYSSDKDAQVENSEKRQKDNLRRFCASKEWEIGWIDGDEATSGDKDKPLLMQLKKEIEEKQLLVDVIVVTSWDRLTRRHILDFQEDVRWIAKAGIKICLQQEGGRIFDLNNSDDAFQLSIKVYEANRFLQSLSNNVRSGLESRFRRGQLKWARAPFGFDKDESGQLVPNEDLQLVPEIFRVAAESGVMTAVPIMRQAKRYQETGKAPSTTSVKTVLRNTVYIGFRTFGVAGTGRHGTINGKKTTGTRNVNKLEESALPVLDVRDKIKPVISTELFFSVQQQLDDNQKKLPKRKNAKHKYSGLVRCSCGCKLIADKKVHHVNYTCPKSKNLKAGCDVELVGRKTIRDSEIAEWIRDLSRLVLRDMKFHQQVLQRFEKYVQRASLARTNENTEAFEEVERLRLRKKRLFNLMLEIADDSDYQDMENQIRSLGSKISEKEALLEKVDVDLDELLRGEFEETAFDASGEYLNLMMRLAKDRQSGKHRYKKEVEDRIRQVINRVVHGKEYTTLKNLLDEISVTWKMENGRCRPKRIVASWKVAHVVTQSDADSLSSRRGVSSNWVNREHNPDKGSNCR